MKKPKNMDDVFKFVAQATNISEEDLRRAWSNDLARELAQSIFEEKTDGKEKQRPS